MIKDCTDYVQTFADYYKRNPSWGSLHIVLEEGNLETASVRYCLDYATSNGDFYGGELATILMNMTRTQRGKVARLAERAIG